MIRIPVNALPVSLIRETKLVISGWLMQSESYGADDFERSERKKFRIVPSGSIYKTDGL